MKTVKQILGFIILIVGPIWLLQSILLVLSLATGYETFDEFFNSSFIMDGEEKSGLSFFDWKLEFWSVISSSVLLKLLGGKFSNLNYKNGYSSEE